jgi:hypothetical protein
MKPAYLIALLCCACSPARAHPVDPVATVRLKFAAFDRHDAGAIQGIYAGEAVLHSPDYPNLVGDTPIADTYRRLFEAIPDAKDELRSLDRSATATISGHDGRVFFYTWPAGR